MWSTEAETDRRYGLVPTVALSCTEPGCNRISPLMEEIFILHDRAIIYFIHFRLQKSTYNRLQMIILWDPTERKSTVPTLCDAISMSLPSLQRTDAQSEFIFTTWLEIIWNRSVGYSVVLSSTRSFASFRSGAPMRSFTRSRAHKREVYVSELSLAINATISCSFYPMSNE